MADALALLHDRDDAKVLAGGQSLVPLLNFRLARPGLLIDLNGVTGLDDISEVADPGAPELSFGALVRLADAERSPLVSRRSPLLISALRQVGHRTIRNRGTIGGSLAHADPAAELPLVLMTTGGRVRVRSLAGERWIGAPQLFVSYLTTDLRSDEILVEARFPVATGPGWAFEEVSRRAGDFALAAACVTLTLVDGAVSECAIGVAGGGPVPIRATTAEAGLVGQRAGETAFAAAAAQAADACEVEADIHASAEYRRGLIVTLVARALAAATARATG